MSDDNRNGLAKCVTFSLPQEGWINNSSVHNLHVDKLAIDPRQLNLTKAAYSVREAIEITGIGQTSIYRAVETGKLRRTKSGKKTLFLAYDLAAFLIALREASA